MKFRYPKAASYAVVILGALLVAACGGGNGDNAATADDLNLSIDLADQLNNSGDMSTAGVGLTLGGGAGPFPQLFDKDVIYTSQLYVANGGDDINGDGSAGNPYETIAKAASVALPGSQINIADGSYSDSFIANLTGSADAPIALVGTGTVTISSPGGLLLRKPRYVVLDNLTIEGSSNGLNIDDGSEYANPDAAAYVIVKNSNIASTGPANNDAIKASGVSNIYIVDNMLSGAGTGSGIDFVGCHDGIVSGNTISGSMWSGVQTKGGSSDIVIHGNLIQNIATAGARGINAGGSTGSAFFRPPLVTIASDPAAENFEAARITMLSNVFYNLDNPVAFTGCVDCVFANNTIVDPRQRIARILQETVTDATYRFAASQNGQFLNNIVRYSTAAVSAANVVNIGANTLPATFSFDNNLWWAYDRGGAYVTLLPPQLTAETFSYNQVDPLFNSIPDDLRIGATSPAGGIGSNAVPGAVGRDFDDKAYAFTPSLGAFEAP